MLKLYAQARDCLSAIRRLADARRRASQFGTDERGVVAMIFAITFCAIFLAVAVAIDFARTETEYVRVQNATDAAALAASHRLGLPDEQTSGPAYASAYFEANTIKHKDVGTLNSVSLDADKGEVQAKARGNMLTSLLKAVGIKEIGFGVGALVKKGKGTIEVALVLDNSGSMAGQPIVDLRTATQNLVNVLYAGYEGTDKVKISLVPFAAAVNVGTQNQGAAWIDATGASPVHYENFAEPKTRFQALSDMGVAWAGCVEVRPSPHDVTDSPASAGTPASLFVPMFNPDEPDSANSGGNSYNNNYIPDDGGTCPQPELTCLRTNSRGNCTTWSTPPPIPPAEAQARTCKYQGASIGTAQGPNYRCDSKPILPLTTDKASVLGVVQTMIAKGGTNILEGLMWGWRVLSPEAPFTEGRAYGDPENSKYIILMTDGENWHQAMSNHNKSTYHSFGYASKGRLGTTYTTTALINQMNSKTLAACQNAKAAGIKVYTVAFRLENDANTRAMLTSCASSAAEAYAASDGTTLVQSFESIAREIAKLRIAG
ncbi:MAG TPA: pilus assembly protein TadG-related protein [Hyphomicrobiaceae bacterium]|nr:pilus assembly protein TadG-related protein [Hyphomicrobiaceae bacterium]